MLEEILELGFDHVELGYDLAGHLVPGIEKMVAAHAVTVTSLHNYCPVPAGAPMPHPEIFTLTNPSRLSRENAVFHTSNTIRFAAKHGARVVVLHCGSVDMSGLTFKLMALADAGEQADPAYDKTITKMLVTREKAVKQQIGFLYEGLEKLMPVLQDADVALAIEILPMWESIPTEVEMEALLKHFNSPRLRYWHDMGHAQVRENLGLTSHLRWLTRLRPWLAGMHVHDVIPPAKDHQMPGHGTMPFPLFRDVARDPILRVIEPLPSTPPEDVTEGLRIVRQAWDDAAAPAASGG